MKHRKTIFKILLESPRVDVNIKDRNGDNLYNIALKTGNTNIIKLIEKRTVELAQFEGGDQSLKSKTKRKNESNNELNAKKFKVEKEGSSPPTQNKRKNSTTEVDTKMNKV